MRICVPSLRGYDNAEGCRIATSLLESRPTADIHVANDRPSLL